MNLNQTLFNAAEKITAGKKKHTLITGNKKNLQKGELLYHVINGHNKTKAHCFLRNTCTGVQSVFMCYNGNDFTIKVDKRKLHPQEVHELVKNEGWTNLTDFIYHYFKQQRHDNSAFWTGTLVHWSGLKY